MYKIYLYTHSFIFKYHRRCEMKEVFINSEYITLAQFLKLEGFIGSGGEAKYFLQEWRARKQTREKVIFK